MDDSKTCTKKQTEDTTNQVVEDQNLARHFSVVNGPEQDASSVTEESDFDLMTTLIKKKWRNLEWPKH